MEDLASAVIAFECEGRWGKCWEGSIAAKESCLLGGGREPLCRSIEWNTEFWKSCDSGENITNGVHLDWFLGVLGVMICIIEWS